MTQGVLIYALNNYDIDYVKLAKEAARRVKLFLGKPVALATDNVNWVRSVAANEDFDIVIDLSQEIKYSNLMSDRINYRRFNDGSLSHRKSEFKNFIRTKTFEISPFDETLVIDADFLIANDSLKHCWDQTFDFLIWKDSTDLAGFRDDFTFKKISDYTIDFYWATVFFFRKTSESAIFFQLVDHIRENWSYYKLIYQFSSAVYRNDHAFSIAIHIMNGYQDNGWQKNLPGRMIYTTDSDLLIKNNNDEFVFLVEKEQYLGEYTLVKTKGLNVHVMNKFSILRTLEDV
jgi:hypothetical protein